MARKGGETGDTHINNLGLARRLPVVRLEDDALQLEDVLDVRHELDKVALPPALLLALAVVLDELPRRRVLALGDLLLAARTAVEERKGRLLHVGRELGLAEAVLAEGLVHDGL